MELLSSPGHLQQKRITEAKMVASGQSQEGVPMLTPEQRGSLVFVRLRLKVDPASQYNGEKRYFFSIFPSCCQSVTPSPIKQKASEQQKQPTVVKERGLRGNESISEAVWSSHLGGLPQNTYSIREARRQECRTLNL